MSNKTNYYIRRNNCFIIDERADCFVSGMQITLDDMDGDGDLDIITNSRWAAGVTWYENTGTTWPATTLPASGGIGGRDVFTGDLDGDGDVDGADLAIFAAYFGRTDCSGAGSSAVGFLGLGR